MPGWGDVHRIGFRKGQIFPELEQTPDFTRADERFAAEVALAEMRAQHVPTFAHDRAIEILTIIAKG